MPLSIRNFFSIRRPDPIKQAPTYKDVQERAEGPTPGQRIKQRLVTTLASLTVGVTGTALGLPSKISTPLTLLGGGAAVVVREQKQQEETRKFQTLKTTIETLIPSELVETRDNMKALLEPLSQDLTTKKTRLAIDCIDLISSYPSALNMIENLSLNEAANLSIGDELLRSKIKRIVKKRQEVMDAESFLGDVCTQLQISQQQINTRGNEIYLSKGKEGRQALMAGNTQAYKEIDELLENSKLPPSENF